MHDSGPGQDGHPASTFAVSGEEVTCQQFVELITDYFEGALAPRTQTLVEEHLVMCDWCVTYLEQMQATIAALRELHEEPPSEPSESVLSALRARKERDGDRI